MSKSEASPHTPMSGLYDGHDRRDAEIFEPIAQWFRPPKDFDHGEEHLVAEIPKREGSDGNPSRIYECRMPARFFRIEVLDSTNSVGDPTKGFALSTGSGDEMGALVVKIALAARDGMLGADGRKDAPVSETSTLKLLERVHDDLALRATMAKDTVALSNGLWTELCDHLGRHRA